jgi:hypothetical protein
MTKRMLTTSLALAAASALALAAPLAARACGADGHRQAGVQATDCDCPFHADHHKADAPKAGAAGAGAVLAADAPCKCEKGGKNCTCPKGKCKCPNCHGDAPKEKSKPS